MYSIGDRVAEKAGRGWQGTVTAVNGPMVTVAFDDGHGTHEIAAFALRKL